MAAQEDLFGLKREQRIIKSGVRAIFTPHQPIHAIGLFVGREDLVKRLIEQINTPGQHALLYGDRGVGKSSLANIAAELLLQHIITGTLYVKRCDSQDTFESILAEPLSAVGVDVAVQSETTSVSNRGSAGVEIPVVVKGEVARSKEKSTTALGPAGRLSPSSAAKALKSSSGLLIIDEADAIRAARDKTSVAEFIKLLSDSGSSFKVMVVGIARTAEDLTNAHPSVQRCLKETKLERMSDHELRQIVYAGAGKLSLLFDEDVIDAIVAMSAGYPHFTHLLALKCAEDAIAAGRGLVAMEDFDVAIRHAAADAEETLRRTYENAVRSSGTEMYRTILCAAAEIGGHEFTASQLRDAVSARAGRRVKQAELNNYLTRLVSKSDGTILRRVAKGVYCFNDPRIPSFIRIANH